MPWHQDTTELPNNLVIAQQRFEGPKTDVTLFKRYNDVIEEDIQETKVTDGDENNSVQY